MINIKQFTSMKIIKKERKEEGIKEETGERNAEMK